MVARGGMHGCSGGVWLLWGGHAWLLPGGACVVAEWGCGCSGGRAWLLPGGACVVALGGACVVFSVFSDTMRYGK